MLQAQGDNGRLPVQLLALVLQKLDRQTALQSCACVNTSWRTAAALSVTGISVSECCQDKAVSLSKWLQAHVAAAATVCSIAVDSAWDAQHPQLLLPTQQLTLLRDLTVKKLVITTAGDDIAELVLAPLTALTSLQLLDCKVSLQGLPALTALQQLALTTKGDSDLSPSNTAALMQGTSQLKHLTSLHLGGLASKDAALAHLSRLTALQQLKLTDACCTASSFMQLPVSLTRLHVKARKNQAAPLRISPSDTPGICQLTALQDLTLSGSGIDHVFKFDVGTLATLPNVKNLTFSSCFLVAVPGGCRLEVMTALTQLQHLELGVFSHSWPPAVTAEDFAAITASQHLTYLSLPYSFPTDPDLELLSAQRPLHNLRALDVSVFWFLEYAEAVISCCPSLRSLSVQCNGGHSAAVIHPVEWMRCLSALCGLNQLTSLNLGALEMNMSSSAFGALAKLTSLRELVVEPLDPDVLGGVLQLTSCQELTRLSLGMGDDWVYEGLEGNPFEFMNKAPEGSPPDVWQQIPSLILWGAADKFERDYPGSPTAANSLLRAAAYASNHMLAWQAQLEQQVEGLGQQVQGLQQQVLQLQGSMAAVLARLDRNSSPLGVGAAGS